MSPEATFLVAGAVVLAGSLRLSSIWRRGRAPSGKEVVSEGEVVSVHIDRGKHRVIHSVSASFEISDDLRFTFLREGLFDRLAKRFGIAHEHQTLDLPFDGRVYIESEDPALHQALTSRTSLRNQLFTLLREASVHEVGAANRRLWIKTTSYADQKELTNEVLRPRIAADFLPAIRSLRQELTNVGGGGTEDSRDFTRTIRRWISIAVAACVLAGVAGLFLYVSHAKHQIVQDAIQNAVLWITGCASAVFAVALFMVLRSTAFTHRVLLDILIGAIPSAWLAASGGVLYYNQAFDRSVAQRVVVPIGGTHASTSRKNPRYYLVARSWPDPRGTYEVEVSKAEYALVESRACVEVLWRKGVLGDGWVQEYQASDSQSCNDGVNR